MADKEADDVKAEMTTEVVEKVANETEVEQENLEKTLSETNLDSQQAVKEKTKIDILLKATANAPIMKKKKWAVSHDQSIGWISEFMKKYLKLDPSERLFLYINQTFAPAPDQTVKNLYDCYGSDGKLIIHYCKSQAWG